MKTLVLGGSLLLFAAAGIVRGTWPASHGGGDPATYRTAPVRRVDLAPAITATGTIVPEDVVDVGAQVNGLVASFGTDDDGSPVDYRSTVRAGSVLARIDDTLYAADVATATAQLAQAEAQLRVNDASRDQARARLQQAERDWQRAKTLEESKALARADYDNTQSALEQAQASVAVADASIGQAQAQIAIARASLQRAQRNLALCTIEAPVDGVILDRRVDIGQTVVASLNAPSLFLLAKDLARMKVLVQVNEADIAQVHAGQPVTYGVDALPGETFRGAVRKVRLNATMTQNVVTYTVEIAADNAGLRLLPYLTANVRFEIARHEQVLAVPSAATRWSPTGRGEHAERGAEGSNDRPANVWVLGDNGPHRVAVHTGLNDGSLLEVASDDLHEGDLVVLGELAPAERPAADTTSPFAPPARGGARR